MSNKILFFCTCLLFTFVSNAQDGPISITEKTPELINLDYDTDLLTSEFFSKNRAALRQLMPANSVAVFFANPIRNRSNDVDYEYHQDPNFYYLSGLREPHAVLLIFK